jgi:hypothetical protein
LFVFALLLRYSQVYRTPDALVVQPSSVYTKEQYMWFERAFPWLFPWGRGGPSEVHPTRISRGECLSLYAQLALRTFQAYDFILAAYDVHARAVMSRRALIRCQRPAPAGDNWGAAYSRVSLRDLALAAEYKDACARAAIVGVERPPAPLLHSLAGSFLASANSALAAAEHTSEHSASSRVECFALHHTFGQPTYWFTYSPDDGNTPVIWMYAKGAVPTRIPVHHERFRALSEHPAAPAMQFKRTTDVFIRYVLGWDTDRQRSVAPAEGVPHGLFGQIRAFFCGVEEQSRGSLHGHWLLWVAGAHDLSARLSCGSAAGRNLVMDGTHRLRHCRFYCSVTTACGGVRSPHVGSSSSTSSSLHLRRCTALFARRGIVSDVKSASSSAVSTSSAPSSTVANSPSSSAAAVRASEQALTPHQEQLLASLRTGVTSLFDTHCYFTPAQRALANRCPSKDCKGELKTADLTHAR